MAKLYGKCFETENIKRAIKKVLSRPGSKTPGPDNISKDNVPEEQKIIKEVKMRLRRCKQTSCNEVISEKETIYVQNLYDRIAQQAVYQIISPILETNYSVNSYGGRVGISLKIPVSKICSSILKNRYVFSIKVDIKECSKNISLEDSIKELKNLGIRDSKLISTIKHLMWLSKDYNGIGLGMGTTLAPVLLNCYLNKLDKWIDETIEQKHTSGNRIRDFLNNKDNYIEWLKKRNKKPFGRYYRYFDDIAIISPTRAEQLYIYNELKEYIDKNLTVSLNEEKTKLEYNSISYLGFRIIKSKVNNNWKIGITPSEPEKIYKKIRNTKWKTPNQVKESLSFLIGLLNFYDISNNMKFYLERLGLRLFKISHRKTSLLKRVPGATKFEYCFNKKKYTIDIYGMRKHTKTSYKEYLIDCKWLSEREKILINKENLSEYHVYKWSLWTRQKGKDPITGADLIKNKSDIHHINGNHLDNRIENLLLINEETHKLLHNKEETSNKKVIKYRKALLKKQN